MRSSRAATFSRGLALARAIVASSSASVVRYLACARRRALAAQPGSCGREAGKTDTEPP